MRRQRKKNQPKTKAQCERIHAKRRALERYNLTLNTEDLHEIVRTIQMGGAKLVERQSNTRSIWSLTIQGIPVVVVYDKLRKEIVSFLPKDSEEVENQEAC